MLENENKYKNRLLKNRNNYRQGKKLHKSDVMHDQVSIK